MEKLKNYETVSVTPAEVCDRQICKYYSRHKILVTTLYNVKFRHSLHFMYLHRAM